MTMNIYIYKEIIEDKSYVLLFKFSRTRVRIREDNCVIYLHNLSCLQ